MKKPSSKRIARLTSAAAVLTTLGAATVIAQTGGDGTVPLPTGSPSASPTSSASPSASPLATQSPATTLSSLETYTAVLNPANNVSGAGSATATFVVQNGQVGVIVEGLGFAPGVMHEQHVHSGTRCATLSDDANGDGLVDAAEGEAASGSPVIPLSLPLGSGSSGSEQYPAASSSGNILYAASSAVGNFLGALSQPGATPSPSSTATTLPATGTTSLTPGQLSQLEGHVVEIHGISTSITLPSSVQTVEGKPAAATLPVACGVIQRSDR